MGEPKLPPCPCCGGKAEYITIMSHGANSKDPGAFIQCVSCHIQTIIYRHPSIAAAKLLAAACWDQRVDEA